MNSERYMAGQKQSSHAARLNANGLRSASFIPLTRGGREEVWKPGTYQMLFWLPVDRIAELQQMRGGKLFARRLC